MLLGGSSCAWRLGFWSLVSGAVPGGRLACDLGGMFESTLSSPPLSDPEDELLLSSKSCRHHKFCSSPIATAGASCAESKWQKPLLQIEELGSRSASFGEGSRLAKSPSNSCVAQVLQEGLDSSPFCRSRAAMRCPRVWKRRTRAPGPALAGGLPRAGRPLAARPSDSGSEVYAAAVGEGCLHAGLLGVCVAESCEA